MGKQKITSLEYLMPVFRERLACGQSVKFLPQGTSMLPMIRQGLDGVVISPVSGELKKYDIPLYQRDNGQYVLHRIIEVDETYTCIGDNQYVKERGIRRDQVIAVVTSFERNGRKCRIDGRSYQLYCRLWDHSRQVRYFWLKKVPQAWASGQFFRKAFRWISRKFRRYS